jgi:hypothetical protein
MCYQHYKGRRCLSSDADALILLQTVQVACTLRDVLQCVQHRQGRLQFPIAGAVHSER